MQHVLYKGLKDATSFAVCNQRHVIIHSKDHSKQEREDHILETIASVQRTKTVVQMHHQVQVDKITEVMIHINCSP